MTQWVPFTGLTALVLVLLLALARASQGVVGDSPDRSTDAGGTDEPFRDHDPAPHNGDRTASHDHVHGETSPGGDRMDPEVVRPSGGQPAGTETAPETGRPASARGPPGPARSELTTPALLANVALTQGVFGAVVLAGAFFYAVPARALGVTADPWSTGLPALGVGAVFGLALWLANDIGASLADAAGASYDEELRELLAPDSRGGWAVLLGLVLPVIAGVEELLFRAAAIGVPAAGFGVSPWALAVVSSTAFAVGHGAQGRVGVAVTGTLGFVLAAGYILSGSLLVVVVAHYLVNALEFLVHEWAGVGRVLS